jgi:ABC-2 type transport system permease protein
MAVTAVQPTSEVRSGAGEWVRAFRTMIRWNLLSLRLWLALIASVQVLAGAGFVLGIALFFDHIPASAALYVTTGVPVINLILVGLVLGPQLVADQKVQHSYEFLRTLPVPQTAVAAAWYAVCLISGIPGVLISLLIAEARYQIALSPSPQIVPAILLTAFTGTMMGYAIGHAVPSPMTTRLITQLLIFAMFGFTPILFPVGQLPGWLGTVNWWLPFGHMATIVRAGLTTGMVTGVATSYLVVAVWGAASAVLAAWAMGRRR